MYILFDPNDGEEISKRKIEEFYGEFSDMVRAKLLAKTIVRPTSVYDLLYPKTRENLLSKNVANFSDLDKTSENFRRLLLAKNQENNIIDNSENIRKSLLARNEISKSSDDLFNTSIRIRESLLAKNIKESGDILNDSKNIRDNNIVKNKIALEVDLLKNGEGIRSVLLSKNNSKIVDLLELSKTTRDNLLSKNVESEGSLLNDSKNIRDNNIAKNVEGGGDLLYDSKNIRDNSISKNVEGGGDLLYDSKNIRDNSISKNIEGRSDLLNDSNNIRDNSISKNIEKDGDLLTDSQNIRDNSISKNIEKDGDLLNDSKRVRDNSVSKNIEGGGDLLTDSNNIRDNSISKNNVDGGDLLSDSKNIRDNTTSKNISQNGNLLTDSNNIRDNSISKNNVDDGDLLSDSKNTRDNLVSRNKVDSGDLLSNSKTIRDNSISKNVENGGDLLFESNNIRDGLTSRNVVDGGDLLTDSNNVRDNLTSRNKSNPGDLLNDSKNSRDNLVSRNVVDGGDLLDDSKKSRDGLIARNVANNGDLLIDSKNSRDGLIARNVANNGDLLIDSKNSRDGLIARNVANNGDLLIDSKNSRDGLIARNVANNGDLLIDSKNSRDGLIARNVANNGDLLTDSKNSRDGLIARNIFLNGDLLTESNNTRDNLIAKNITTSGDLLTDSKTSRDNLLSNNVNITRDLLADSSNIRNFLLSKNTGGLLGVNIDAAGTSAFIGVSRVLVQGAVYRALLNLKNNYTKMAPYVDQNGQTYQNVLSVTQENKPWNVYSRNYAISQNKLTTLYNTDNPAGLLNIFGNGTKFTTQPYSRGRDGKMYGSADQVTPAMTLGVVTEMIARYSQEKNLYNLKGLQPGGSSGYADLTNFASRSPSLNDLIQTTVGALTSNQGQIIGSPTNPTNIIARDQGAYMGIADPAQYLKPQNSPDPSNVLNIVQHQGESSSFDNADFKQGNRGVRRVVKAIKNSSLPFAKNLDVQASTVYIAGNTSSGAGKKQIQRWTLANPYKANGAQNLNLYFKNYSNNKSMFFPAYISSFGHESSASWNEVNFLGRPEPLFTYNNTKRTGTISFFVLTDYAQAVDIGYNFSDDGSVTVMTESFPRHFTENEQGVSKANADKIKKLQADNKKRDVQLKDIQQKQAESQGVGETATLATQAQAITQEITNTNTRIFELQTALGVNYSESSNGSDNVYNDLINNFKREDGYYVGSVRDTKERINDMKQNLKFQPAYFSGDKVDFVNRIEFLEKMVRPSRNDGPGFSFIKPPVCHMHLGDWINHDIIINNISYDMTDAPWTLDGSDRVQPMWTKVSMSFNITGIYRHVQGPALTSSDEGGYFSDLVQGDNINN